LFFSLGEQGRMRSYEVQLTRFTGEGDAVGHVVAVLPESEASLGQLGEPCDSKQGDDGLSGAAREAEDEGGDVPLPQELHVPGGIPGERVIVSVAHPQKRKKRRRHLSLQVRLVRVLEPSPWRVEARCPYFGTCGGCQFQHVAYERQLEIKREMVAELLRGAGGFAEPPVLPTLPCAVPWNYRNHMRFSVNREGQVGLTARGSRRVIPLENCPIAHPTINRALKVLAQTPQPRPQALVRCGAQTGQLLLQPVPAPALRASLEAAGLDVHEETFEEELAGKRFLVRPSSFFQTNTAQAGQMAALVLRGLKVGPGVTVVDAYCGVGTFALLLAQQAGRVIAIEESASAVRDARFNVREAPNVEVLQGKTEEVLPRLTERIDGLVLDPPRQGCQQPVLDALAARKVPRVVYVSCDPATLARDLRYLCQASAAYQLMEVQPLDMFPQTAHIECVAVLCLAGSGDE
jgi:23S rRNA (uracil1939-C5)-methyltransferase